MRCEARLFLGGLTAFVAATIVAGFVIIPSPMMQRLHDLDQKKLDALDSLASAVNVFWLRRHRLPADLAELQAAVPWSAEVVKSGDEPDAYRYSVDDATRFRICATFGAPSSSNATGEHVHPAGPSCEVRTVMTPAAPAPRN